mmetsp:Transcript_8566/g.15555  ORF Transcript_8566/g.15555 Transcript_8566/m.15555 type:complete len:80 (-) Transcript_8566:85-324(-)
MSSSNPAPSSESPSSPSSVPPPTAIEEDDDFEEFVPSTWDSSVEEKDEARMWQDNWDDDDIEDDFTEVLRKEIKDNEGK